MHAASTYLNKEEISALNEKFAILMRKFINMHKY